MIRRNIAQDTLSFDFPLGPANHDTFAMSKSPYVSHSRTGVSAQGGHSGAGNWAEGLNADVPHPDDNWVGVGQKAVGCDVAST